MASAWTLIEDTGPLASPAASITFSDLTDYTKFRLTLYVIKDGSAGRANLRINGDTGTNYAYQRLSGSSTTVSGQRVTGDTSWETTFSGLTSELALITVEISKPLTSTPARGTISSAAKTTVELSSYSCEWNNTADAISSISILSSSGNFAAGTRAVLEGAA